MSAPFQFNTTERDLPYILFYDTGDQVVPTHWHRELELAYIIEGSAKLLVNDEMYEVKENEAVLINGGDSHFYFSSTNHKRLVIIFNLDIIDGSQKSVELKRDIYQHLVLNEKTSKNWTDEDKSTLVDIIERLEKLNNKSFFSRELLIRSLVFELLYLFTKEQYERKEKSVTFQTENKAMVRLQKVFFFIEQNFTRPISLNEIADVAGFEPSYFTRFFKSLTNVTFYDYLTNYRISKAQYMLVQNPELTVGEVAEACGFTSIKTFNRAFLKFVKIPPTKFRKVNI